jgi:alkaline phosphatase D
MSAYLKTLAASLSIVSTASAAYESNLNYRSASLSHPQLGIELAKVHKRTEPEFKWDPKDLNFTHGVASGDPYAESVILWTRIAPTQDNDRSNVTVSGYVPLFSHETEEYVKASKAPVCVYFRIATDNKIKNIVDQGRLYTSSDIDVSRPPRLCLRLSKTCS